MAKTNKGRKLFATTATAALVASAIVPVASAAQVNDYNSIASYAQEAVQDLVDRGVVQGDANGNFQPRKSVSRAEAATVLSKALGLTTTDAIYFTDVKSGAWYYDAINAAVNNGVFSGKGQGKFDPNGNLTRGEAAVILVSAFNLNGKAPLAQFADEKSVKEWAKESLEIAVGNGVVKGDNGRIKANDAITKQDFAVMFARAEEAAETVATHTVKAINNTTVEVTFDAAIADIKALDFKIEGLEVKNAVVKQTDAKTAVLTTATQTAGTEYSVTVNGESVGKFTGVSAVIPTAIKVTTPSVQGTIGKEVTVSAEVTVPEGQSKAGIPVTFNIVNDNANLNNKIEVVAYTNESGVASHTYTRYYEHNDNVVAYATQKSSVSSQGKVYWNAKLAVSEITTGNDLANGTKKSYKVNGAPNSTYYVAIKENLNVNPDQVKSVQVQDSSTGNFVTPVEIKNNPSGNVYASVRTNANGEGAFVVYGSNVEVTPVVYDPTTTPTTNNSLAYNPLDLQTSAPTVKFSQVNALAIDVVGEGTPDAAEYTTTPVSQTATSVGGRTYTVTVKDKDGKVAPAGTTAYVYFKSANYSGDVYVATGNNSFVAVKDAGVLPLTVGKDGKVQFRVAGKGATAYVKPTVFLNTDGKVSPVELNSTDVQKDGEVTYFKSASVVNASLTVQDQYGRQVTSVPAGQTVKFVYQSVDQNGFPYRPTNTVRSGSQTYFVQELIGYQADGTAIYGWVQKTTPTQTVIANDYLLTFDVNSTFGNVTVGGEGVQNLDNTKTYQVRSQNGKAEITVTTTKTDTVRVNVTGVDNILPTISASVSFTGSAVVPNLFTGTVQSFNAAEATLKFSGIYDEVSIDGENVLYKLGTSYLSNYAAFIETLRNATGSVQLTREVNNGVTTFTINNIGTGVGPTDESLTPNLSYTNITGTVGTAITAATPTVTGLPAGAVVTYASPALPDGLTINSTTGAISGTPTAAATTTVTVTGTYKDNLGASVVISDELVITVAAAPTAVTLATGSEGTAGDKKVTGLTAGTKYVVTEGTNFYGVLADGTLSAAQTTKVAAEALSAALTSTEITGLTNGTAYKVEVVTP